MRFRPFLLPILGAALLLGVLLLLPGNPAQSAGRSLPSAFGPRVVQPEAYDLSPALRDLPVLPAEPQPLQPEASPRRWAVPVPLPGARSGQETGFQPDGALQAPFSVQAMQSPKFNFEGVRNQENSGLVLPPDTNGDVGPNHYVQFVNLSFKIWSLNRSTSTATLVKGPLPGRAIWDGFTAPCGTENDGDVIVLYDHLADRWFFSQFAWPNGKNGPFYQCIAVSQTGDPTGSYYRYQYKWTSGAGTNVLNDYPKFGVWPDGYYMSVNQFTAVTEAWRGTGVAVFDRTRMLQGQPASMVSFDLFPVDTNFSSLLPSDLDGQAPPAGTPNYFAAVFDNTVISSVDTLRLWEFHVDWANPSASTFGQSGQPDVVLPTASFNLLCFERMDCIPQAGTTARLDALADRLMYRLQYRYFGAWSTLVANHTVDVGGGRAGIRWYQLQRNPGGWSIQQQGTYAGDGSNSEHRWVGSLAMDKMGDIALGYSVSSSSVNPSIRYTGRRSGDTAGTLPQGEVTLQAGGGSQTSSTMRWGDYTSISVDPLDDCTFWYTNEYYAAPNSDRSWLTRVGSFVFPECLADTRGALAGRVVDASTLAPLANVQVRAGSLATLSDSLGYYRLYNIPAGVYTITARLYGYTDASAAGVNIQANNQVQQNFSLNSIPAVTVSGRVIDGNTKTQPNGGWPLYAQVAIAAPDFNQELFTHPLSGAFSLDLPVGVPHTFTVSSLVGVFTPTIQVLTPSAGLTHTFELASSCQAPWYSQSGSGCKKLFGGLLAGHVRDQNTAQALNDASLAGVGAAYGLTTTASSFANPSDPRVGEGFFELFLPYTATAQLTAAQPGGAMPIAFTAGLTVTKARYGLLQQTFSMTSSQVVSRALDLPAGQLSVLPASLSVTVSTGQVVSRPLIFTNTGGYTTTLVTRPFTETWLSASPPSPNPILPGGEAQVMLTITGTHCLQSVTLQFGGDAVPYADLSVPVSMVVGDCSRALLPFAPNRFP